MTRKLLSRRAMLIGAGMAAVPAAAALAAPVSFRTFKRNFLNTGEWLALKAHQTIGRGALAREFSPEDLSPVFRSNGSTAPGDPVYRALAATGFAGWRLKVGGLVERPLALSLADLRALPARQQITRHDCVEGWSAIGEWKGTKLSAILDRAGLRPEARFIVFRCADTIMGWKYYESIDLIDAFHPQTILAYEMNGRDLPMAHGAPIRLRVERQLGYKHAKFVMEMEAVDSFADIGEGKGGFWQDASGYEWYAGI